MSESGEEPEPVNAEHYRVIIVSSFDQNVIIFTTLSCIFQVISLKNELTEFSEALAEALLDLLVLGKGSTAALLLLP